MSFLVLIAVFGGFVSIGAIVYWYGLQRKRFFADLVAFCGHLSIEISFSKLEVAQVIGRYSNTYSGPFRRGLEGFRAMLDARGDITHEAIMGVMWARLKPEEQSQVAEFLFNLGRHGSGEEIEKLATAKGHFEGALDVANARLRKEAVLYLKLFVIMGIASVIMLA